MPPAAPEDAAAAEALQTVLSAYAASVGVLLEPGPARRPYRLSASVGVASPVSQSPISATSLLPKWIRANGATLPVPDKHGIWSLLPPVEQAFLSSTGVTLAIPLLDAQGLVAWAGVVASGPSDSVPVRQPSDVATRLRSARQQAADRDRRQMTARAQRLSLTGQLAAGIAHEIRNPLAAIQSMVQLMQSNQGVPAQEMLARIQQEIGRMRDVLSGMLTLGQPTPLRDAVVDLAAITQEATTFCRPYAAHRGQTLRSTKGDPLWVRGDAHELRQVIINLLMNACQASQINQQVLVETMAGPARRAVVRITDSGCGMSPDVLAHAYEPFFTTKPDGGGLGLVVSLAAVRRHGGDLVLASDPGAGTVATLTVPLTVAPTPNGPTTDR